MSNKIFLTHNDIDQAARKVASLLHSHFTTPKVYAIPRGGVPAAYAMTPYIQMTFVDHPEEADIIVDDLVDTGRTMRAHLALNPEAIPVVLFGKICPEVFVVGKLYNPQDWLVFPWEATVEQSAEDIAIRLLQFIGEDPDREGLKETPARFLRAWQHYTRGYKEDPASVFKTFEDGAENCDEMVIVRDIPFYSHCEHHLTIIAGKAHVGYIPSGRIVGLSKIARLVDIFACRLQVQERLGNNIVDEMVKHLNPLGVGVVLEAEHFCMTARGVEKAGTTTITSATRGVFRTDAACRAEFFSLVNKK